MSRGLAAAAVMGVSLALLLPAQAQFWDWGNRPQRQQQQPFFSNPFGGWFSPGPRYEAPREAPVDYSHAPPPSQKKPEATIPIVVIGDANADWLAYGLEEAFSEKPEIAIVRKHRTDSGLIRYEPRRDTNWAQVAREIIAAEKPKSIVMMIGNNDRQTIREKAPPPARPGAAKPAAQPAQPPQAATTAPAAQPADLEQEAPAAAEPPANLTPEQARQAAYGPWEFHTEKWELAYIKRIDATIAALKSVGVPVFWVGLPSQRGPKASADSAYLNEIYRSRAEKAGILYIDIWDGFVDEAGRYSPQGPDYEGQIRRLRSGDGVYYTKFGARKLAHYVEREIERTIFSRGLPVALPMPVDPGLAPNAKPGGPAQRPMAGPVVPLTAANVAPGELLGGGRTTRPAAVDPTVTRVLTKGEPIAAPSGRADDFSWPRGGKVNAEPAAAEPAAAPPATPAPAAVPPATPAATSAAAPPDGKTSKPAPSPPAAGQRPAAEAHTAQTNPTPENPTTESKPPVQRRARPNPNVPRPPLSILQGLFR